MFYHRVCGHSWFWQEDSDNDGGRGASSMWRGTGTRLDAEWPPLLVYEHLRDVLLLASSEVRGCGPRWQWARKHKGLFQKLCNEGRRKKDASRARETNQCLKSLRAQTGQRSLLPGMHTTQKAGHYGTWVTLAHLHSETASPGNRTVAETRETLPQGGRRELAPDCGPLSSTLRL